MLLGATASGQERAATEPNLTAVQEVLAGKRKEANAAWWGFDERDTTKALQAAIRSGAKKVTVPNMGKPWVVGPLFLESDQEIVFEKGVVVQALKDSFLGVEDSLFTADGKENITMRGYGAEWVVRKEDYRKAPYTQAQWRHCLTLLSCRNVNVLGLRLTKSGGDGIYVGRNPKKDARPSCEDIHIKDVICDDNYRQGISVISVKKLLIESSTFQKTGGHAPMAGIDFEPNEKDEFLINCEVRNCTFKENAGYGMLFALHNIGKKPVSIRVEGCTCDQNREGSMWVLAPKAEGRIELLGNKLPDKRKLENGPGLKVEFGLDQEKIDKAEVVKKELAALQGTWRLLRWEEDGKVIPIAKDNPGWSVKGTKVKNGDHEGTLELVDVTKTPARLNIQFPERKLDEFIYVRAGDYLIMCGQRGGPRPSEFKTAPHEQGINQLFVWKMDR
jgi:uncharacterized protein (TIGR03067 family)